MSRCTQENVPRHSHYNLGFRLVRFFFYGLYMSALRWHELLPIPTMFVGLQPNQEADSFAAINVVPKQRKYDYKILTENVT